MARFDQKAMVNTPKHSVFPLTYESIGTLRQSIAYPVVHKEIVPGDHFAINIDHIMRLAPIQSPVFDDVEIHFRAFFTPNRILDPRWKEFITGGVGLYGSSDNEIEPLRFRFPALAMGSSDLVRNDNDYFIKGGLENGGLADWLNFHIGRISDGSFSDSAADPIPIGEPYIRVGIDNYSASRLLSLGASNDTDVANSLSQECFSLLPFLGYQKIYDDWYRNERVQAERLPSIINYIGNSRTLDYAPGSAFRQEAAHVFYPFRVNYGKDRFTTGLPEPNVGGEVSFLNGVEMDVSAVGIDGNYAPLTDTTFAPQVTPRALYSADNNITDSDKSFKLIAQLAQSAQATIQQLKTQFKMYSFFMKDTYNGNRYVEFMDSHFDVRVPDATLDRAIYLGQHKVRISFGEVFQTSAGDGSADSGVLGDYAGRGASYSENAYLVNDKFLEHGQLYVIASIVPRAKYYQGVDRKFIKKDRFSYFFPEFQDIGDDQIFTKELFFSGWISDEEVDNRVFCYNARWSELKESLDEVHGDFRGNMDHYHFARVLASPPVLGSLFSQAPTINRPFSVVDEYSENYLLNARFNISASRPLMMFESF